jgi:hypothetical protein
MSQIIIAFCGGLFLGVPLGLFMLSLLTVAREGYRDEEEVIGKYPESGDPGRCQCALAPAACGFKPVKVNEFQGPEMR